MDDPKDGNTLSGVTLFYTEFYELLDKLDSSGRFDAVLTMHTSGTNKIAAKGAILMRIIAFVLKLNMDDPVALQFTLHMLGKSHCHKQIRPWQYSVFVTTLLNVISSRLGPHATDEVMSAWVNLFAFVMKTMLPAAIQGLVVETELSANVSTQLDERAAEEIREVEENKVWEKNSRSGGGSVHGGGSRGGMSRNASRGGMNVFLCSTWM